MKAALCALSVVSLLALPAAVAAPSPHRFVRAIENPWLPFRTGSTWVYRGAENGERARDVVTVRQGTKVVAGVRCTVVSDRLYLAGKLAERTSDWYAQDVRGNVWYFGEATAELDSHGRVTSREGSWQAGVHGARPGVVMPAHPRLGARYRQEYLKGHAEDWAEVLSLATPVRAPAASSSHALLTKEWTPLEPSVVDHKVYVRGIGNVAERTVKGGTDHAELVAFHRG